MGQALPPLTTGEAGDILGVQSWRIARLFDRGAIPDVDKVGGRRIIPRDRLPEIAAALAANKPQQGKAVDNV